MTEGVTGEQVDFEEDALSDDRHAQRRAGVSRDRQRQANSDAKHFSLRGFSGKGFQDLRGPERQLAMVRAARRARINSGTDGLSRRERQFRVDEGLLGPTNRPSQPWTKRTGKKKNNKVAPPPPFSLRNAVARFKRTGDLPTVPLQIVQEADSTGVDGRVLRRMISAMLLAAGVEPNPGPMDQFGEEACRYSGQVIQGEWVPGKGKKRKTLVCSACPAILEPVRGSSSKGRHPPAYVDGGVPNSSAAHAGKPAPVTRPPVIIRRPSAPTHDEENDEFYQSQGDSKPIELPAAAPAPLPPNGPGSRATGVAAPPCAVPSVTQARPSLLASSSSLPALSSSLPVAQVPPRSASTKDPPGGPPTILMPVTPPNSPSNNGGPKMRRYPEPPKVVSGPLPLIEHKLLGHNISGRDKEAIMSRLAGVFVHRSEITTDEIIVDYKGERRLAPNRNVIEIKQGFKAVELTCDAPMPWVNFTALLLIGGFCTIFTLLCKRYVPWVSNYPMVAAGFFTAAYLVVRWFGRLTRRYVVDYVPHVVSAVMSEYDRGTNATAARATIRQKVRRLASLPLPDEDALKFIVGSELVCEQLLMNEDFFWEGAASFRRP